MECGDTWGRHEIKHAELGLGVPRGGRDHWIYPRRSTKFAVKNESTGVHLRTQAQIAKYECGLRNGVDGVLQTTPPASRSAIPRATAAWGQAPSFVRQASAGTVGATCEIRKGHKKV